MKIGVIGAGFMGRGLAVHGMRNGHEVMLSNSRGPDTLRSAAASIGCKVGTAEEAAAFGDIVFVAVPLKQVAALAGDLLNGKILVDLNNHYPDRDGPIEAIQSGEITTSEYVAGHFPGATVVKAFNAIMINDLEKDGKPAGAPGRRGLPYAGDDPGAKAIVAGLIDQFGFGPVDAGSLADSWRFERARPTYCVAMGAEDLRAALDATERDSFVAEYSWRR